MVVERVGAEAGGLAHYSCGFFRWRFFHFGGNGGWDGCDGGCGVR